MERMDIADLEIERPRLYQEIQDRGITEVWRMNDTPTSPDAERAGKRTLILLGRKPGQEYILLSTKGNPDKVVTWLHDGGTLAAGAVAPDAGRYVMIDKSKLGRKRRELTDEERQAIKRMRSEGQTINQIAKELHLGTLRVMEYARELKRDE